MCAERRLALKRTGALLLLLGSVAGAEESAVGNLAANGGFEDKGSPAWRMGEGWSVTGDSPRNGQCAAHLRHDSARKWRALEQVIEVESNGYYAARFAYRSTIPPSPSGRGGVAFYAAAEDGKTLVEDETFAHSPSWQAATHYFYSGMRKKVSLRIWTADDSPGEIWIDDVEVHKLGQADLRENLVLNPGFEADPLTAIGWQDWYSWMGEKRPPARISVDPDEPFIVGRRSLKIDTTPCLPDQCKGGVRSTLLPVIPGGRYMIEVWLKGDRKDLPVHVLAFAQAQPGYWWSQGATVKASESWRRYEYAFTVPAEAQTGPARMNNMVHVAVSLEVIPGVVWADSVSFRHVEAPGGSP